MNSKLVFIYSSGFEYELRMIQGMLEEHGIFSTIMNKKDTMYGFGDLELYVSERDVDQAKDLIKKFKNSGS